MTQYVLDTDVLIALQMADGGVGLDTRGPLPVVVTDVVWDELDAKGDMLERSRTYAKQLSGEVSVLAADSPEAGTFVLLQIPPKTEGPGEHSVISYCIHHPEAIAVLQDKLAVRRGVEELRGRVLSFHGWLGALVELRKLTWDEATAIAGRYRRQYSIARLPVWWPRN